MRTSNEMKVHWTSSIALTAAVLAGAVGCNGAKPTSHDGMQGAEPPQVKPSVAALPSVSVTPKAGPEVLVQEVRGLVVRSERDASGNLTATVHDADQRKLLAELTKKASSSTARFRIIGTTLDTEVSLDGAMPLSKINLRMVKAYASVPSSSDGTSYTTMGCTEPGNFLDDCGENGGCCDRHDRCYDQVKQINGHNCVGDTILCTSLAYAALHPGECIDCVKCDREVVACVWSEDPGQSVCCELKNCNEDTPDCCVVKQDGSCDCAECDEETKHTPACNPMCGGNPCVPENKCVTARCEGVYGNETCSKTERNCDDGKPCTEDTCDPDVGCRHEWMPDCKPCPTDPNDPDANCEISDKCTTTYCDLDENRCVSDPSPTVTAGPCETVVCDPTVGWMTEPKNCNGGDECLHYYCEAASGDCVAEEIEDCDSDNAECLDCGPGSGSPGGGAGGSVIRPIDPNEKTGPAGTGEEQLVSRAEPFAYKIDFENMDGATASAQEVVVVDYLSASFDWTTVDFGEINFGGHIVTLPDGVTTFASTESPAIDGCVLFGQGPLAVQTSLDFDVQTGRLEMRLKVINPDTQNWPEDPWAGILPPGLDACSQGHVTFTITAASSTPAGTVLTNTADIVFDYNDAITTNEVWNTLGD